jgi:Holliday junction resolvase RusA-like endonuclease
MNELTFTVLGKPISKKRPRFRRNCKKPYNPQETEEGRWLFAAAGQIADKISKPIETSISMKILFTMPIPSSWSKKKKETPEPHTKKPDIDNLIKFCLDCLNGYLFRDDRQITYISAVKEYGDDPVTKIVVTW